MVLIFEWHVITNISEIVNPATGSSATNWNLMNTDAYDSTGSEYSSASNRLPAPETGTAYSYERWIRGYWSGVATSVSNIKIFLSSGTLSDANLTLFGGATDTYTTPIKTVSTIATSPATDWDVLGEAFDITPSGGISSFPAWSNYFVAQLAIANTVTTPGDIGTQTLEIQYDEV